MVGQALYWRQVIGATIFMQRSRFVANLEVVMERAASYVIGALALGGLTATLQGFGIGGSHWVAAAFGGPVTGLPVGGAVRLFTRPILCDGLFGCGLPC